MKDSWRHLLRIYRIMLNYWGYMISGLITMVGFALVSGVSITMVIPLFDYVFRKSSTVAVMYFNSTDLIGAVGAVVGKLFGSGHMMTNMNREYLSALTTELGMVLEATEPALLLKWICFSIISLVVFKNILFYLNKIFFANLRGNVVKDARIMLFEKYLYSSLSFLGKNRIGDSIIRITGDVATVSNLCIASLFNMLRNLILVVIYASTAMILNARLFLISMAIVPVYALIVSFLGGKLKKYARRQRDQSAHLYSTIAEKLDNMYVVKAFVQEQHELTLFKRINQHFFKYWRKSILYSAINTPLSEMNGTMVGVLILIVGGGHVISGETSLGGFTAFLFAVFSTLSPIKKLTKSYINIKKASIALERVAEILDLPPEVAVSDNSVAKKTFDEGIVVDNISFSYGDNEPVLKNVSFTIAKGERVALVGKSGSGKTTLVNLLPRLYDVTEGAMSIDGVPLTQVNIHDLRRLFGIVTQESVLFSDTIEANLSYGATGKVALERIKQAAKIAYADEFIESLPKQYQEEIQPRGSNFSGGQKQRLCIARAILNDPPILIFDEATSALDSDAENKVQRAIEQATTNRTVVVIAHRLSTIVSSDKIIVMDAGRIVGMGKSDELLQSCPEYRTLYDLQFNV